MHITAFICEFNPLHDGHRFFIRSARRQTRADYLIALMSGDAVTPKEVRREIDPPTMKALIDEATRVIAKAITMKEKKYDDDSVHDAVLEEIEKKEARAD